MMSGTPSSAPVDGHHEAVFRQMTAIAQHFVADLAGPRVVDQHAPDRRLPGDSRAGLVEDDDVAILGEENLGLRVASGEHALGHAGMLRQLAILAMDRDEVARAHEREHQLELFLAAVAGDVDVLDAFVNHVGAAPGKVIDHAPDRLLVPRNRARRDHDRVVVSDLDEAMVVDGHARQRRHRFALRSGTEAQHVLRGVARDVGIANLDAGRYPQIAEALRNLRVLNHPAPDECDFAIELRRQIHEDLHPVGARCERRDDQFSRRAREDLLERFDDLALRSGEPAAIDVRAVGEQREDTLGAELREAVHVEVLAVDRRLVDLEIARVHDDAHGRVNGQRHTVGHAVGDADELHAERADGDALARTHRHERVRAGEIVLRELRLDERKRQRRPVDRAVDERRHVRHGADVILVTVRQHERGSAPFLLQVRQVRNDPVHAQQLGVGEHDACVDEDRRLAPREREHVHAEFAESAERNDFEH